MQRRRNSMFGAILRPSKAREAPQALYDAKTIVQKRRSSALVPGEDNKKDERSDKNSQSMRDLIGEPGIDYNKAELLKSRYLHRAFIMTGYRAYLSFAECAQSMFRVHNELVDIWTHFVPACVFLALVFLAPPWADARFRHTLVVQCLCFAFVCGTSAFAHTFNPINRRWHRKCFMADWASISVAVYGLLLCNPESV